MFKLIRTIFSSISGFIVFFTIFTVPIIANGNFDLKNLPNKSEIEFIPVTSQKIYSWPTPGYTTITCNYGYRKAPTAGASTYHGAIDIGAPTNAKIIACFSGKIIYTGFYGANGYTIMLQNNNITAVYSHLSGDFIVNKDTYVSKNQVIGKVGPKNIYNVPNNKYKDASR